MKLEGERPFLCDATQVAFGRVKLLPRLIYLIRIYSELERVTFPDKERKILANSILNKGRNSGNLEG